MELDDLKIDWNKSNNQQPIPVYQLNSLINTKSAGSLNTLKVKYRKQTILLPMAAGILGIGMIFNPALQQNALIWFIIPVMLLLALMYYRDYRLVLKMEQTNQESIKESIARNISLLQQNAKQHLRLARIVLVTFIIILESMMYSQQTTAFNFWQSVAVPLRILVYLIIGFVQPFVTKYFFDLSFGRHLQHLKSLSDQAV